MRLPILLAAPHRLAFLTGSINLALLALWWLVQISGSYLGTPVPPAVPIPASLLHAPTFLFLIFPPFIFGFLLTVIPRWLGYPDLGPRAFGPVAGLQVAGALLVHAAVWAGAQPLLPGGFSLIALGWVSALFVIARLVIKGLREGKPICWHALFAVAALVLGFVSLALATGFMLTLDLRAWSAANTIAIYGFILPIFLAVAHRMVPFFAGNVVTGYAQWRPDWLLAVIGVLLAARLSSDLGHWRALELMSVTGMAGVTALMAWKWWPRAAAPGLLNVLIWGFAWAPVGFALAASAAAGIQVGRAPTHALLVGFAGTMLVAMVTRVTQGHSGSALQMPRAAWLAFATVQLTAVSRVVAALSDEHWHLLVAAALLFALGPLPWLVRNGLIYLAPRSDGGPG